MDISENGWQIGEKLFILLEVTQKNELTKYVLERKKQSSLPVHSMCAVPVSQKAWSGAILSLTEIRVDDLYFYLEERTVLVRGKN